MPVFILGYYTDIGDIKNIVFATNLDEEQDFMAEEIKKLQQLFNAKAHILWVNTPHVIENEDVMKEKLENYATRHIFSNYTVNIIKSMLPDKGILSFAEQSGADMIALATHGRKGIAHIFSGSLAEDVVNHAKRPVWTLSTKAKKFLSL